MIHHNALVRTLCTEFTNLHWLTSPQTSRSIGRPSLRSLASNGSPGFTRLQASEASGLWLQRCRSDPTKRSNFFKWARHIYTVYSVYIIASLATPMRDLYYQSREIPPISRDVIGVARVHQNKYGGHREIFTKSWKYL